MNTRNSQDSSPLFESTRVMMNFYDALKLIAEGKKVHKLEWGDEGYYGFLDSANILSIHKPDGMNYQWILSLGDIMGEDYIMLR